MLHLAIHHNVHLTKEQRYDLHNGIDITTVGVSIPVWFMKSVTSEPGIEIFCRYYLKNPKNDIPIKIVNDGYEISLPYRMGTKPEIDNEEWRRLSMEDPNKLKEMYDKCLKEVSSKNLLDICDGGGKSLCYKEHNKINQNDRILSIMHFVNIKDIEHLTDSFD